MNTHDDLLNFILWLEAQQAEWEAHFNSLFQLLELLNRRGVSDQDIHKMKAGSMAAADGINNLFRVTIEAYRTQLMADSSESDTSIRMH